MTRARTRSTDRQGGRQGHQRRHLAQQIARLMWEDSIEDFRLAKEKAVRRFGLRHAELPDNREIARELQAYSALFAGTQVAGQRDSILRAAIRLMPLFEHYSPRLVGVEDGAVLTPNTGVRLHLFSEQAEALDLFFQEKGLEYQLEDKRFRFGPDEYDYRPTYQFEYEGMRVRATVFPDLARSRVPLSPVDGKPMRRYSYTDVCAMQAVLPP